MSDRMIDGLANVILSLKPSQRKRLITRLAKSRVLSENEEDKMLLELRRDEPSEPYEKVRKRLKKKGRLK